MKNYFKEIISDNKVITLPQSKALSKQNKIHFTCVKKDKLIEQLIDNNIITPFDLMNPKIVVQPVKHNMVKNEYEHFKNTTWLKMSMNTLKVDL